MVGKSPLRVSKPHGHRPETMFRGKGGTRNVTNETIVEARRPGTGKSFGLLSWEVLDELKES